MDYIIMSSNEGVNGTDLKEEIIALEASNTPFQTAQAEIDGKAERANVLFIPSLGRGGVGWGSDADWSDADSVDDLLERYCGINDKEMVN